jgi:transcriptional regulator with XRE-family HTH domain
LTGLLTLLWFAELGKGLPKIWARVSGVDIELTTDLAAVVLDRRAELGMTHDDVARAGGPSSPTMTKIENGRGPISDSTMKRLERALGWVPGSIRAFAKSGELPPLVARSEQPASTPKARADVASKLRRMQEEVEELQNEIAAIESTLALGRSLAGLRSKDRGEVLTTGIAALTRVRDDASLRAQEAVAILLAVEEAVASVRAELDTGTPQRRGDYGLAARSGMVDESPDAIRQRAAGEESQEAV